MFKDFPSTSAMKTHLEMEYPAPKKEDKSPPKKKKPEIEVETLTNDALRDPKKKLGNRTSPITLDSKLKIPTSEDLPEEPDEYIPERRAPRSEDIKKKAPYSNKATVAPRYEEVEEVLEEEDEPEQEFHGNIKGLLRKSRNKKENISSLEEVDPPAARPKTPHVPASDTSKNSLVSSNKDQFGAGNKAQKSLPPPSTGLVCGLEAYV